MARKPAPAPRKPRKTPRDDRRGRAFDIAAFSLGAAAVAGGVALLGIFARRREGLFAPGNAEHAAPDLAPDAPRPGTDRAPEAFRPDPTAPVPDSEREGLRPATGPAPTLVAGQPDDLRRPDAAPA